MVVSSSILQSLATTALLLLCNIAFSRGTCIWDRTWFTVLCCSVQQSDSVTCNWDTYVHIDTYVLFHTCFHYGEVIVINLVINFFLLLMEIRVRGFSIIINWRNFPGIHLFLSILVALNWSFRAKGRKKRGGGGRKEWKWREEVRRGKRKKNLFGFWKSFYSQCLWLKCSHTGTKNEIEQWIRDGIKVLVITENYNSFPVWNAHIYK